MPMPTSHFYYVYILRDVATGKRHYTGVTHDLQERLAMHNAGMYRTPPNLHHGILKPLSLFETKKKPLHMNDISKQVQAEHTP